MWGAGPAPVVGCTAQAAQCGKGHPLGKREERRPRVEEAPSRTQRAGWHSGAEHSHGEATQRGKQGRSQPSCSSWAGGRHLRSR